ncbi:uncharacterized protein LOC114538000 [Dendronephthya gigantea]|uniref:uncharacterized protein LOC114538000 n=1 Tax=Dendronephthya gigantea TaxID=151771 RepID=UPI0010691536|nr:uncharacterized protein LOC114538000 [Dendronephthya gigantea]
MAETHQAEIAHLPSVFLGFNLVLLIFLNLQTFGDALDFCFDGSEEESVRSNSIELPDRTTINNDILKKKRLTGSVKDCKIPGSKRKTTRREDNILVRKSKADRFKTAPEIKAEMQNEHGVNISVSTTQRSDCRVYVRRMVGEDLKEYCVQPTVKHGGGGIMVWGCIDSRGTGCLSMVNGRLNGSWYISVLENALLPTTHMLAMPDGWVFQQDNATCHTSRVARNWFEEEEITVMEWPARSPDLNPIENL